MPKSKAEIIEHLASVANVSRDQARVMLEGLVRMAYREARTGFTIPGLCKIELVDRDARTMKHPQTGEMIEVPARKVLRIRPVEKAKEMVARVPHAADAPDEEGVPMVKPPAGDVDAPGNEPIFITFSCTSCGTQIEASTDMAGMESQCPGCGAPIKVPSATAINQLAGLESLAAMQPSPKVEGPAGSQEEEWQKGSTIKIEMPKGDDSPIPPVRRTIYIKRRN